MYSDLLPPTVLKRVRGAAVLVPTRNAVLPDAWREAFDRIEAFSRRHPAWRRHFRARNGAVHGPLLRLVYGVATLAPADHGRRVCRRLVELHLAALDLMRRRVQKDFGVPRSLSLCASDPHRGNQPVARLGLTDGRVLAYKARSVEPEAALFGAGGWAEEINGLLEREGRSERLPVLQVLPRGPYGYVGWVEARGLLRPGAAVRIPAGAEGPFWRDAGLLAAAAWSAGLTDLHDMNLTIGRGGDGRLRFHVIDAELELRAVPDLDGTGLTTSDLHHGAPGHAHAGFESERRACGGESDRWGFEHGRLRPLGRYAREGQPALAVDARGRVGYGPHLADFVEGMMAGWDLLVRHRPALSRSLKRIEGTIRRVVLRPTTVYRALLDDRLLGRAPARQGDLIPEEERQLGELDIPYFFRNASGRVGVYNQYPMPASPKGRVPGRSGPWPMSARRIAFHAVALPLQDALDHVVPARRSLRVANAAVAIERRAGTGLTRIEARIGRRLWRVRIDARRGRSFVELD